jgi:hypothetical protein
MHYSFIISQREGQIDLHFEPNPVFSDWNSQKYFIPNADSALNGANDSMLFPYRSGLFKEMISEFKCVEYCGKNLGIIVVRSQSSNSARQGSQYYERLENAILREASELGFYAVIFGSDQLTNYRANANSLMDNGLSDLSE